MKALEQMRRVCAPFGKLVVSDFHEEGFKALEQAFRISHGKEHQKTDYSAEEVNNWFNLNFEHVVRMKLQMCDVWIASHKKGEEAFSSHKECFACGRLNREGLNLSFSREADSSVTASCTVGEKFNGYPGIVQGGVIAVILDAAMANCLHTHGIEGVTARMSVKYLKPVKTNMPLTVKAQYIKRRKTSHYLRASVMQEEQEKTTAEGVFFPIVSSTEEG
jgi:uncharacterized protein (TIGR00369 family)